MSQAFGIFSSSRLPKVPGLTKNIPNHYPFSKRHMALQNKDLLCPFLVVVSFAKCFCIVFKDWNSKPEQKPYQLEGKKKDNDTTLGVEIQITKFLASVVTQILCC